MSDRRGKRSDGTYFIEAILTDGSFHIFVPNVLDVMLANKQVTRFRRSNGWVNVGSDPIRVGARREANLEYHGPERRAL